jgi:hypothetical protein
MGNGAELKGIGSSSRDWNYKVEEGGGRSVWINSLWTEGDFCRPGQATAIAHKFKVVETYWHDHSLESYLRGTFW